MTTPNVQRRHFTVVEPSTRVYTSPDCRYLLSVDAEGGSIFRWASGYYELVGIPTLTDAAVGNFRHSQFGSSEIAVICGDQIRRFGLRLDTAELSGLEVPGASALVYSAGGNQLIVGTVAGDLFAYSLDDGEPSLIERIHVCDQPIAKMIADPSGETLTLLTEGWQCWFVSLTDFTSSNVDEGEVCAFAYCHETASVALADRSGFVTLSNGETKDGWKVGLSSAISIICFVSATQLGVALGSTEETSTSVEIINLDQLEESDVSQEPELNPAQADRLIFIDGVLTPVYSELLTRPAEQKHRELVVPYTEHVWGLGRDAGQLVVVHN